MFSKVLRGYELVAVFSGYRSNCYRILLGTLLLPNRQQAHSLPGSKFCHTTLVFGPEYARYKTLRDNSCALDAVVESEAPAEVQ